MYVCASAGVYVFMGARVLCAFRHVCLAPCMVRMDTGSHVLVLPPCGLTDLPESSTADLLYGDLHNEKTGWP